MSNNLVYQPPGVYVDENASPVPNIGSVTALPPSRVALVGPAIGYQSATETVQLGGDPVALANKGIDIATIVVSSLDGVVHTDDDDYDIVQTGTPATEAATTIERDASGAITLDAIVYVTYEYTNTAYYQPYFSTDWDEIQTRFGPALDAAGAITSPLSLAAKIVLEQGAREIICVPTNSAANAVTAAQLDTAYGQLLSREDVGIVVPLPVAITGDDGSPGETTTAAIGLKTHITAAVADGKYRIGVFGLEATADRSHDVLAQSIESKRIMLAFPNVMNWYNGYSNLVTEISGYYLAAAYAGTLAAQPAEQPLTRKQIRSFSSIPARIFTAMTRSFKDNLSGNGVAVTEAQADGRLIVRHGISTDTTNVLSRETSVTRAQDTLLRLVDQSLERSGLIGDATTADSPIQIRSIVEGALEQALSIGIINGYSNLAVRSDEAEPTIFLVKFAYDPAYPLNKINVSFSINTTTGTSQEV